MILGFVFVIAGALIFLSSPFTGKWALTVMLGIISVRLQVCYHLLVPTDKIPVGDFDANKKTLT
jgi:hypothetical protein